MADRTTFQHEFFEFSVKDSRLYLLDQLSGEQHEIELIAPQIKTSTKTKVPAYLAGYITQ